MFLEASGNGNNLEQPVIHENAAHFVPPPIAMELPPPLPGPTSVEVPPPLPGNLLGYCTVGFLISKPVIY